MSASPEAAKASPSAPLLYIEKPGECCMRSDTRISRRTGTWPWKSGRSASVYIASISGELGATAEDTAGMRSSSPPWAQLLARHQRTRFKASWGLAETGGQHAAHIDPLDRIARDAGALDRRLDRGGAEIGRRNIRQNALHAAHRGARIAEDDDGIGC